MLLQTVIESTEGLDEALVPFYTEQDGKFVLQIEGVDAHPDVANLKSAFERQKADNVTLKAERDTLKAKASAYPDDFDADKWAKLKDGKPDEAALIALRKELETERDQAIAERDTAKENARKNAVERDLTDALTEAGVTNPSFAKAARTMLSGEVKVGDDGLPYVDTDMGPVSVADRVKRWAAGEGKDFVTPPQGGGAKGGNGGGTKPLSEMTGQERFELAKAGKLTG